MIRQAAKADEIYCLLCYNKLKNLVARRLSRFALKVFFVTMSGEKNMLSCDRPSKDKP